MSDYIHFLDLADAHVLALEALIDQPQCSLTMNAGYGRGFSVLDVLDGGGPGDQSHHQARDAAAPRGRPDSLISNNARIKATVPWVPRYADLDVIVGHALAWERRLTEIRGAI